jgi:hypothetical protein
MYIPQNLYEAARQVLLRSMSEALESPEHKRMASLASSSTYNAAGISAAQRISKKVMPQDTITIPLERDAPEPDASVVSHLAKHGYHVAGGYSEGLAAHESTPTRKVRIGKILDKTGADATINTRYEKDPARQGIKGGNEVIEISRDPHRVAAMSTHENFQSCQTLGGTAVRNGVTVSQDRGCHADMVPGIVKSGAHIAYLYSKPEDIGKSYKAVSRVTLNPFLSADGRHKILRPSKEYGDHWAGFHSTVKKWAEKNFPAKYPIYTRHNLAYPEGEQIIRNYAPEHDEFWKTQGHDSTMLENHPSLEVLNHHASGTPSDTVISSILKNKHAPNELINKMFDRSMALGSDGKLPTSTRHTRNTILQHTKNPDHIQKILDAEPTQDNAYTAATNPATTSRQLHDILDKHPVTDYLNRYIRNGVMRNKNSNDSHLHKILDGLHQGGTGYDAHRHGTIIDEIAAKYHSPEVGKKLIDEIQKSGGRNKSAIHDIARKNPELLHHLSDKKVDDAVEGMTFTKGLENELLRRGTPSLLATVASHTSDHTLLDAMAAHHDPHIAVSAQRRKLQLTGR